MEKICNFFLQKYNFKNYIKNIEKSSKAKVLTKKPIIPEEEEIKKNPKRRAKKTKKIKRKKRNKEV